jgi:hypothetical protein
MARQEFEISRHLLVLGLTVLVFLSGIAIGSLLNNQQVSAMQSEITLLKASTESIDLQSLLADAVGNERACPFLISQVDALGTQLDELAGKLTDYEKSRKFGESFESLKEQYMTLLVREWLFAKKAGQVCGNSSSTKTILYFYTNKDCPGCTGQGVILDVEKRKMGQGLLVFPLDTDLGMPIVESLLEAYNITGYPSLVVGDAPLHGFVSKDALEAVLSNA